MRSVPQCTHSSNTINPRAEAILRLWLALENDLLRRTVPADAVPSLFTNNVGAGVVGAATGSASASSRPALREQMF